MFLSKNFGYKGLYILKPDKPQTILHNRSPYLTKSNGIEITTTRTQLNDFTLLNTR